MTLMAFSLQMHKKNIFKVSKFFQKDDLFSKLIQDRISATG